MGYSFESRVRYSEIGENGCLELPGILDYFQDCCTFQSESIGQGIEVVKEKQSLGFVFLAGDRGPLSCHGRDRGDHHSALRF